MKGFFNWIPRTFWDGDDQGCKIDLRSLYFWRKYIGFALLTVLFFVALIWYAQLFARPQVLWVLIVGAMCLAGWCLEGSLEHRLAVEERYWENAAWPGMPLDDYLRMRSKQLWCLALGCGAIAALLFV